MCFAVNIIRIVFQPKFSLNFQTQIQRIRKKTSIVKEELDTAHMSYVQRIGKAFNPIAEGAMDPQSPLLPKKIEKIHHIPHSRNDHFFGREDILQRIQSELSSCCKTKKLRSVSLHALGGQGKTQIALEYTYQHLEDYDTVLWILSNSSEKIEQEFIEIATLLGLERTLGNANHARNYVLQWLSNISIWFDP